MFTIYQVTNAINGKRYIGYNSNYNERKRFNEHFQAAKRGSTLPLHAAIRKYGKENFSLNVLEMGENEEYGLKIAEPMYILWLKPEYNICAGGEGTPGKVWSEESKKKSSITQRGRKLTEEHKKALRVPKSVPVWNKGRTLGPISEEQRGKLMGRTPWNKGKSGYSTAKSGFRHDILICPHCNLSGGDNAMKRYHFENCKVQTCLSTR
jgi:group I intron endonuclease